MKISFLVLVGAFLCHAEITSEAEFIRSINTPDGFNHCFGARLDVGHNAEYTACVRKYFPHCLGKHGKLAHVQMSKCVVESQPTNISHSDIQRRQQQQEWLSKHPRK